MSKRDALLRPECSYSMYLIHETFQGELYCSLFSSLLIYDYVFIQRILELDEILYFKAAENFTLELLSLGQGLSTSIQYLAHILAYLDLKKNELALLNFNRQTFIKSHFSGLLGAMVARWLILCSDLLPNFLTNHDT